MRYGSICSGIEAASVAWESLGWDAAWVSEIEPFPCAVLQHHYPQVPNLGDLTADAFIEKAKQHGSIDLIIGGTPCQSFSVAGLRGGLDDDRGNLALHFMRVVDSIQPTWVVWENVPGVLSSNGGRDFGSILGALAECGYGFAYRVLDAQFFGVPQRRRRVFVVGYLGGWRRAATVLFERQSLQRHSQASREAGQDIAPTLTDSSAGGCDNINRGIVAIPDPAYALADESGTRPGTGRDAQDTVVVNARQDPVASDKSLPLGEKDRGHAVAIAENQRAELREMDVVPNLSWQVRRLTPRECERLQGFPDDHTLIPWRNKPADQCPDGPRYRAIGNSMAVPVIHWLGQRIEQADAL